MIKKDIIIKLLVKNKLVKDEAEAIALYDDKEEKDVPLDDSISIFTKEELSTRDKNKYNTAKDAVEEMLAGSLIDEHKLNAKKKDMKSVLDAFKTQVLENANVKVDDQIKEKNIEIEKLRSTLTEKDTELSTWQTKSKEAENNSKYIQHLPSNRDTRLSDAQWLTILKGKYSFMDLDGKEVIKDLETGEVVRDAKLSNPLHAADVFKKHFEEKQWVKTDIPVPIVTTGRGGQSKTVSSTLNGKPTNMKEFLEYAVTEGGLLENEINSQKANALLQTIVKENPQFDFAVTR